MTPISIQELEILRNSTCKPLCEHRFTVLAETTITILAEPSGEQAIRDFKRAFPKHIVTDYNDDLIKEYIPPGNYVAELVRCELEMDTYEVIMAAKQLNRFHCGAQGLMHLHAIGFLPETTFEAYYVRDGIHDFEKVWSYCHAGDTEVGVYFRISNNQGLDTGGYVKGHTFVWFRKVTQGEQ